MQFPISAAVLAILAAMPAVQAHMDMVDPVPIKHPKNPNTQNGDFDYTSPLKSDGSNFPCKGHLAGSTEQERTPVATWPAGSQQKMTVAGGAAHEGGSCQVAISEDNGSSFKVLKSFIGNCPLQGGDSFEFTVPPETKSGPVVFAWTWFNKVGNREMYMNCASVEITGGGNGLTDPSKFPDIFTANIDGGKCTTEAGKDVEFPNPGPNIDRKSTDAAPPVNCGAASAPPVKQPEVPPAAPSSPAAPEKPEQPPVAPSDPAAPTATVAPSDPAAPTSTVAPSDPAAPTSTAAPSSGAPPTVTPPAGTPPAGGACTPGEIICDSLTSFSLCNNGVKLSMGQTAAGTVCVDGKINFAETKRAVKFRA